VAKTGALSVAERAQASLVPVAAAARRRWVLERAWDAFELPAPFTEIVIALGPALEPGASATDGHALTVAIERARERAGASLGPEV
jgi:lysophospholipid acyltransferase (LPLAT)-like uncharacterized protein